MLSRNLDVQVSLDMSDALVAKNPSGSSRTRVKEGYLSRISRIHRPIIVRVIEGPTYRGTPVQLDRSLLCVPPGMERSSSSDFVQASTFVRPTVHLFSKLDTLFMGYFDPININCL